MSDIKKVFSGWRGALPWIFIVVGILLLVYGYLIAENVDSKLARMSVTAATAILSGGVFAVLLKTMQIMGVIREELEQIIYGAKFLENRKDLIEIWEKVSKAVFSNKFPNISKRLLDDIKNTYFPTGEVIYYNDQEHHIDIKIDSYGILTIDQKNSLDIICVGKTHCFNYEFSNTTKILEGHSYDVNFIKVNKTTLKEGTDYTKSSKVENKQLINSFVINLKGEDKYEIERQEIRKYSIHEDDTIYFKAAKLTNGLTVEITHPPTLEVSLEKVGTLKSFLKPRETEGFKKYVYKEIVHKEQGYLIRLKHKQ